MTEFNYRVVLFALCFCFLSVNCNADEADDVIDTAPVATFGGFHDPAVITWLGGGRHVQIYDDIMEVEYCSHPKLLLCIEEPYQIFLPKTANGIKLKIAGSFYEIAVSSGSPISTPENICDAYGIWLRIRDTRRSLDSWYFFFREQGLSEIVTFMKSDRLDQVPGNILLRSSGKIFALEELCDR